MKYRIGVMMILALALAVSRLSAADLSIGNQASTGAVNLVLGNSAADIYVDMKDLKLTNIAAGLLADDVQRVTGKKPRILNESAHPITVVARAIARRCMSLPPSSDSRVYTTNAVGGAGKLQVAGWSP